MVHIQGDLTRHGPIGPANLLFALLAIPQLRNLSKHNASHLQSRQVKIKSMSTLAIPAGEIELHGSTLSFSLSPHEIIALVGTSPLVLPTRVVKGFSPLPLFHGGSGFSWVPPLPPLEGAMLSPFRTPYAHPQKKSFSNELEANSVFENPTGQIDPADSEKDNESVD